MELLLKLTQIMQYTQIPRLHKLMKASDKKLLFSRKFSSNNSSTKSTDKQSDQRSQVTDLNDGMEK